jgi:hypothetical protein
MMLRRMLSRKVTVLLGIAAVAVAVGTAGCFGGEGSDGAVGPMGSERAECDLNDQECVERTVTELVDNADCDLSDPECVTRIATELGEKIGCELSDPECPPRVAIELGKTGKMPGSFSVPLLTTPEPTPSPEQDAAVREILFENEVIKAMVAGREEGRDYWIRISYVYEHRGIGNYGEKPIAMVDIYFDPPLSYAGELPAIMSDPCAGHGVEGWLDPDDPCVDEPKEYGSAYRSFADARCVTAQVNLPGGEVVTVFQSPVSQDDMEDIQTRYGQ